MMWCGNDDIMRWLHSKRLSSFLIVVIISFFSLTVICFWGDNLIQKNEQKKVPAEIRVNYQIQHGSIYTGDQTPIVYEGTEFLKISENGLGANGLPIMGFFPERAKLPFTLNNGDQYVLHIPVIDESPVISLAINSEDSERNRILFRTKIQRQDNQIFIEATSITRGEWKLKRNI